MQDRSLLTPWCTRAGASRWPEEALRIRGAGRVVWAAAGGGYGIAGDESDLGLVEVGVRCSLEQMLEEGVRRHRPPRGPSPRPHPPKDFFHFSTSPSLSHSRALS